MPVDSELKKQTSTMTKPPAKFCPASVAQLSRNASSQRGFSLIEVAIIFCVSCLLIAGLWYAAGVAIQYIKTNQMAKDILSIVTSAQALSATNPNALNIGQDGGCTITSNTCPPADPNSPGNYLQYTGVNAAGQTVTQTSTTGLVSVTTQQDKSLSALKGLFNSNCGSGSSYYTDGWSVNGGNENSSVISLGIIPSDLIKSGNIVDPWGGNVNINIQTTSNACSAGNNSSLLTTAVSSLAAGSSTNISTMPGYTPATLSFTGQLNIILRSVPVAACASLLGSYGSDFINRGLTGVGIAANASSAGFGGTVSTTTGLSPATAATWCAGPAVSSLEINLAFNVYK